MKKTAVSLILLLALQINAQTAKIEIPETYELSNIILALTEYGITDKYEVQKNTDYYQKILTYFEPVKNHPLLDSVNYSREKWEDYLSFRTDAVAFSFDDNGKLKRDFAFYTNPGHNPFDRNLDLIDDFVIKSNFRTFFSDNIDFYNQIINNYEDYNYVHETVAFLDSVVGGRKDDPNSIYKIILSPLVYRMNCHRQLAKNIEADFPSATEDFINGVSDDNDISERLNANHSIFTEKDHEYVNPITAKYINLVSSNFDTKYWDYNSGYEDFNCFNEYMTWAVYDLFLVEKFPDYAKELSTYWQYQNASRGFFAQNLFSDKVLELYQKNKGQKLESVYEPLLSWAKEIEHTITLPTLINIEKKFVEVDPNRIRLDFSESMNTRFPFGLEIREYKNSRPTGNKNLIEITDFKWADNGKTVTFKIDTDFNEFCLIFNWWGIEKPLISENGIFLETYSAVWLKK